MSHDHIISQAMQLAMSGQLGVEDVEGINTTLQQGPLKNPDICPVVDLDGIPLERNEVYQYRRQLVRVTDWRFGSGNMLDTYYYVYYIDEALRDCRTTIDVKFPNGTRVRLYQAPFKRVPKE